MAPLLIRRGTLADQVADDLRARIISGELAPGTHLVEGALAVEYDVSRAPVREALQRLTTEHLVENGRRRGLFVVGLSSEDIDELYSLRFALEQLAFERAIANGHPPSAWAPAQDAIETMRRAAKAHDIVKFADADLAFHHTFYELARHGRLTAVWEQCQPTFAALFRTTIRPVEHLNNSVAEHERLLQFAIDGDIEGGLAELKSHLERAGAAYRAHHGMSPETA